MTERVLRVIGMRHKIMRIGGACLLTLLAAVGIGTGASSASADAFTLGNCSENILNDGIMAWDASGEKMYFANTEDSNYLYVREGEADTCLAAEACSDINVLGNDVYFVTNGAEVMCYREETGSPELLFTVETGIDEMYVTSKGDIYYLSAGDIYVSDLQGEAAAAETEEGEIRHFIPTSSGMIYAMGDSRDYALYADGDLIAEHVFSFYTNQEYLLFTAESTDYQAKVSRLFHGSAAAAVEEYTLGDSLSGAAGLAASLDSDECEVCEENAEEGLVDDDWDLAVESIALLSEDLDASTATQAAETVSILDDESVSDGQRNIVRRAYQQHLVEWTPQKDVSSWKGSSTFSAGVTYTGLPYGQPTKSGVYTPWGATFETFVEAVDNAGSVFYTTRATNGSSSAPYYSCDCSSFVSWAWDLPSRQYTGSIGEYATTVSSQSIYSVQIGDAFNLSGSHVCMVSDIGYQGDTMVYVDIIEQTPPITKLTRYGEGGSKTLADLNTKYLNRSGSNYVLIRSKTRDQAEYVPSSAVLLPGETAGEITLSTTDLAIYAGKSKTITYEATAEGSIVWSSSDTSVATVSSKGKVTGVAAGTATITLRIGPTRAYAQVTVYPGQVQNIAVKALSSGGVKVTWDAVTNAEGYRVYRKKTDGGSWEKLKDVTATKYSDTGSLSHNTEYTYTVRAYKTYNGTTKFSTYDEAGVTVRTVTATPKLLSIEATSYKSQTLTWKAVKGAEKYRVYCMGPDDEKWVGLADVTDTSYTNTGLTTGGTYRYTVRAYFVEDSVEVFSWYDEDGISKMCVPATPVLLKAKAKAYNKISLSWEAVAGAQQYRIYRKTEDTDWVRIDTVDSDQLSYVDTKLPTGMTYIYTVRALRKSSGKNVLSSYDKNGVSASVNLSTPALVSAESKTTGKITLTWSSVSGAQAYRIYRKEDSGWVRIETVDKDKTSYTDTGLTGGEAYTYTVRAYREEDGRNVFSGYDKDGITAVVKLKTPTLASAKVTGKGSVKVTWSKVTGAEYYRLYRKTADTEWVRVGDVTKTAYTDTGLEVGIAYTYTVRAVITVNDEPNYSGYDKTGMSVNMKPETPVLVSAESLDAAQATVTWEAAADADGYYVYYKLADGSWSRAGEVTGDVLTFTQDGFKSGATFYFTVRAYWLKEDGTKVYSSYDKTGISAKIQ